MFPKLPFKLSFIWLLLSNFSLYCDKINLFKSDSIINKDGTIVVHETITVTVDPQKHGIVREFPTLYFDRFDNRYRVKFDIIQIKKDGFNVPYTIREKSNGKALYIGDPHYTLKPGSYTYSLSYLTNRQIGFFKDKDEFYWNVTGNGWRLEIEKVLATVTLPTNVDVKDLSLDAYTGYEGEKGKDYKAKIISGNQIFFEITRALKPYEGLTIAVSWPKGIVQEPTWKETMQYFFQDNGLILWLIFGFLLTLLFYIIKAKRIRQQIPSVIIPRFDPPNGMTPSQVRYLLTWKYDSRLLTSELINMAVFGLIIIHYKKKFLGKDLYTLELKSKETTNKFYTYVIQKFFAKEKTFDINTNHQPLITHAISHLMAFLSVDIGKYFDYNSDTFFYGLLISAPFIFSTVVFYASAYVFFLSLIAFALLHRCFYSLLQTYTPKGQKLVDEVQGFKLFLETTEEERLKIIGTPPTKNPELYEKYLPYAIALGVESQWSKKFAPIFERSQDHPQHYIPLWYQSNTPLYFNPVAFSSSLNTSINNANYHIASSSLPPGSSSGSDGGGSSGGGGGGGGGGTW